jgi:hypothetical protein
MKSHAWFDEPSNRDPGGSPYPPDQSLAEAKKDKKTKDKKEAPEDPGVLEVVTVLEGIDILPFLEDDDLFQELLDTIGLPVLEKAALQMEPAEGTGQFSPVIDTPDYQVSPTRKRRNKNKEECPVGGPGKGKGLGRGDGKNRKASAYDAELLASIEELGEEIGINWDESPFDVSQFIKGIEVEFEHGTHDSATNVTGDDVIQTAKIAWAHLKELPDYYDRLEIMEEEGKKDEEQMGKYAGAHMTLCPNCGTIQRVEQDKPTECSICKFPIPPYSELHPDDDLLSGKPKDKREQVHAKRIEESLKSKINKELIANGLDGNTKFEKPSHGLTEVAKILHEYGVQLEGSAGSNYNLSTADSGQMHILVETTEDAEGHFEDIENASVSFSWYKLGEYAYECIAYLG